MRTVLVSYTETLKGGHTKTCIDGVMNCDTTIWQVNVDRHKTNIPQYHLQDHIPLQTPALENLQNRTEEKQVEAAQMRSLRLSPGLTIRDKQKHCH